MEEEEIPRQKVVIIGSTGTGKSCLLMRMCYGEYSDSVASTIFAEHYSCTLTSNTKRSIPVMMWDTAGQEQYESVTSVYLRNAACVLFAFDITRTETFDNLNHWFSKVNEIHVPEIMILVGTKTDLDNKRTVSYEAATQWANAHDCSYIETSAKTGDGCPEVLAEIADKIAECLGPQEPSETIKLKSREKRKKKRSVC